MPLRRGRPIRHIPTTVSDAIDGTNAPAGAMAQLSNLIPDLRTNGVWVPRPAADLKINFANSYIDTPGFVSSLLVIGDIVYGTIASERHHGFDEPFCYDLNAGRFIEPFNIRPENVPASPAQTGEWTPPILAQVGSRVITTHPGFPGGLYKFGWFDVSGFNVTVTGNIDGGSTLITGNPSVEGVQPGMLVGANIGGISPGAYVVSTRLVAVTLTGDTHSNTTIDNLPSTRDLAVGQTVAGVGIPSGAVIASIIDLTTIVISAAATTTATESVSFAGAVIEMSAAAYFATVSTPITIAGGSSPVPWTFVGDTFATGDTIYGNPLVNGAMPSTVTEGPGMFVSGPGIVPGTRINRTADFRLDTTGDLQGPSSVISNILNTTGVAVGQRVTGAGIPSGVRVASVDTLSQVTLTQNLPYAALGVAITFIGSYFVLDTAATLTQTNTTFTAYGQPLWGAGDTDRNNLLSVPVGVAQFNGRAYFALGRDGIPFSDPLLPCRITNNLAVQVLTTNDGLAVTGIFPLLLQAPITGGIVQALIVFQGASKMQQIQGDAANDPPDLAMDAMPVVTGTLAPLSVVPTYKGLAFMSPDGLRFVQFDGGITDPVGSSGKGVVAPFQYSAVPSRMCGAANNENYRITTRNGQFSPAVPQEYWFNMSRGCWSGPHSSVAALISAWRNTFLLTFIGTLAKAYQSDSRPGLMSSYNELGANLTWTYQTSLMPDDGDMHMNSVIEMALACTIASTTIANVLALSDFGAESPAALVDGYNGVLDSTGIPGDAGATLWGHFNWNEANWGEVTTVFRQRPIYWHIPLVFKQASFVVTGVSAADVRVGNFYLRHDKVEYFIEDAA